MQMFPAGTPPSRRRCALAISAALACLLAGVPGAAGQNPPPRAVAVIDATAAPVSDTGVAQLASRIESQLDREDLLVPVAPDKRPALVGAVPEEGRSALLEARGALSRGRDALARFAHRDAADEAARGIRRAVELPPAPEIVDLLADLAFMAGLAHLRDGNPAAAARELSLVRRLTPARTLDPVEHLPEVIAAFDAAGAAEAMSELTVDAPDGAVVWIDGVEIGPAPATVRLPVGPHALTVTGERLVPRGQIVDVGPDEARVRVDAAEASVAVKIQRHRRELAAAADDRERAERVARLVRLVGGQDAIVVGRDPDGALVTWTYSGRTATLGEAKPADEVDAVDVVKPLRPIIVPRLGPPDDRRPPPPPPPPWWEQTWVQASIGGGIALGVLTTVVVLLTRPIGESQFGPDGRDAEFLR